MTSKTEKARFYKVFRIQDWDNEMIITILFRAHNSFENLYIEAKFFLMPMLINGVKEIDKFKSHSTFSETFSILFKNIIGTPILLLASPFSLLLNNLKISKIPNAIKNLFRDEEMEKEAIGNSVDINKIFRKGFAEYYFQTMDRDFYFKSIEKRILNSLTSFLEKRNIDISEFKENRTYILNNGIMMSGGEMKGGNITVGSKNKITQNKEQ